jgi:tRNA splicing endonuclease
MATKVPPKVANALMKLFNRRETITDKDVHDLAAKMGINPHKFEGYLYSMLQQKMKFSERLELNRAFEQLEEGPYIPWAEASHDISEPPNLDLPQRLIEAEMELLNRFSDETLSDEAYEQTAGELVDLIDEAVAMRPGTLNVQKGDWVRLKNDTLAKVVDMTSGQSVLKVKNKSGRITFVKKTLLGRIGKYQGKPAFGYLTLKGD